MFRSTVIAAVVSLGLAAAAGAQTNATARGIQVYADQKCALCHAIAGKGNAKGALDDVGSRLSSDDIRLWIVDAKGMTARTKAARKPVMKDYVLPKDDLDALVAYMASLKKK